MAVVQRGLAAPPWSETTAGAHGLRACPCLLSLALLAAEVAVGGCPLPLPADDGEALAAGLASFTKFLHCSFLLSWQLSLPQEMPFATAARLLGWQTGEPGVLSATTLRKVVRDHGGRIRSLEQTEAVVVLRQHRRGRRLRGVPCERTRRRPGWPEELSAAVWERVRADRAEDATRSVAALRRLGPEVAPGQMLLVLDEVLTPAPGHGQTNDLRTACLLTADGCRYLSGRGIPFLRCCPGGGADLL